MNAEYSLQELLYSKAAQCCVQHIHSAPTAAAAEGDESMLPMIPRICAEISSFLLLFSLKKIFSIQFFCILKCKTQGSSFEADVAEQR